MGSVESVFKAYDIRGRVDSGELDGALVRAVGAAFASWSGADRIAIGYDCRPSSPGLADARADGITSVGCDVDALGAVPTDLVYFVSGRDGVPGVMITASHNPADYNGFKLVREEARPISADTGLADIRRLAELDERSHSVTPGSHRDVSVFDDYVAHMLSYVDTKALRPLRLVVNTRTS